MAVDANTHWRDSARAARFFFVDARAAFPLLLWLMHMKLWTFIIATVSMIFFALLEKYGFTVIVFGRWLRSFLAGPHKAAQAWWNK